MRSLGFNLLSAATFALLAAALCWALGIAGTGAYLVLGVFLGMAPSWPYRRRPPGPDVTPALRVDPTGTIAYLKVREGRHDRTVADVPQVNADFDAAGNLLGVEFVVWPLDDRPAVPQAWPPYGGYGEDEDEDDNEGEEWKQ